MGEASPSPEPGLPPPGRILLPAGLVGLPSLRRFRVRPIDGSPVLELTCLDERSFSVLAVPMASIAPKAARRLADLGLVDGTDHVFVLLAAHGQPPVVTANLAGPIVVDPAGRGQQLVLEDPAFPLRAALGST